MKDGNLKTSAYQVNTSITKESLIKAKLQGVNQKQKSDLDKVINGINGDSRCDGTTASGAGTSSSSSDCKSCTAQSSASTQGANTACSGGDGRKIETDCKDYTKGNGNTSTCSGQSGSDSTKCTCGCAACTSGKVGECCCFYKDSHNTTHDKGIKDCLGKMVGLLNADGLHCNSNGKDCLMCYLCVLKCKMTELKDACNVGNGGNGNLHETLGALPQNIISAVTNICGTVTETSANHCCKNCTDNCCRENGTCQCGTSGNCCQVNDRYSNFTKFLLGTCSTSVEPSSNNKCKTITDTLTDLNGTLNKFITGIGENSGSNGCKCNNGSPTCAGKCCCGTNCSGSNSQCTGTQPIKILSCVIECGLKGIKERSTSIVNHIENIETCLKCIQKKMTCLKGDYDGLHGCISELGQCVREETKCIDERIKSLKDAKQNNQTTFKEVIDTSKVVLSYICGY